MLQKLIHKRLFYICFFVFLGMRYALSAGKVLSFDFFKVRTLNQNIKVGDEYTQQSYVDDAIIGTVIAQISFGESTYSSDKYVHDALRLYQTSQTLVGVDVLELVKSSDDPQNALDVHLNHVEKTIEEIGMTRDGLRELASSYQLEADSCLSSKREGDKLFFDGASDHNQGRTAEGLEMALEYGPCYMTNRIYANAYAYLADRVATNYAILVRRRDILQTDGRLFVEHRAYLETGLLDQLNSLKRDLNNLNQVEYEEFRGIFDFTFPYDLDNVPKFNKIFFDPDEVPTYLDPVITY